MKTKLTLLIAVLLAVTCTTSLGQPTITLQPTNFPVLSLGASVGNRVLASGAAPLSYQWRHDGAPLVGKTTPSITLTNLKLTDKGAYDVVVTNISGATTSSVVTLNMDSTFTKIMSGPLVTDLEGSVTGNWADYDGDGFADVYVANTGTGRNSLYHNEQGTNFTRVVSAPFQTDFLRSWFAAWADYDNDGNVDLIAADLNGGVNAQRLYRNNGNGTFSAVSDPALRSDSAPATSPWWFDYDNDGFLDLFAAKGFLNSPANDVLFQNQGDGTFRKMKAPEVGNLVSDNLGSEFCFSSDYDNDGRQELLVYYNQPNGYSATTWRYENGAFVALLNGMPFMALACGDYDNDEWLDAFGTSLFHNLSGGGFAEITEALNMTETTSGAPPTWGDYDNDGWLDLFFTGNKLNGFFQNNRDGTFTQVLTGSPVWDLENAWAPVWVDYDNDGFLDLFVAVGDGAPQKNRLYHNNGNANHWLKVKLDGRASNRSGIGARVRAEATISGQTFWQVREINCGVGQGGQSGLLAHFGLGDAANVKTLQIQWPSGIVQELQNVSANQFLTIVETQGYTNAPPQFSGAASDAGGVQLSFSEPAAGARYIVEASTNLVNWTKLMARTSVGAGTNHIDSNSPKLARRFYRLAVP